MLFTKIKCCGKKQSLYLYTKYEKNNKIAIEICKTISVCFEKRRVYQSSFNLSMQIF